MTADVFVEVSNLSVAAKDENTHLIKGVSFTIPRAKTVALVGESGSGKSLTSLALMGLLDEGKLEITEGLLTVHKDGLRAMCDIRSITPGGNHRDRKFSMIFQEPMSALNPLMTCGRQVWESARLSSPARSPEIKQQVLNLFREVMLPAPEEVYNKYPHELSGGQRQRVMIAMALASSPQLLIADEPTTALDVTVQSEVLKLLNSLRTSRSMSLLFITHDLGVVAEIADEVIVMWRGEIVEAGPTHKVLMNPEHPYTRALIACRPTPQSKGGPLITVSDFVSNRPVQTPPLTLNAKGSFLMTAEELNKRYPNPSGSSYTQALKNVSLTINGGETLGLVGESGWSRLLLGFVRPDSGAVNFRFSSGEQLRLAGDANPDMKLLRSKVQLVFQDPFSALNPKMLVRDIMWEPMANYFPQDKKNASVKMKELLSQVGLPSESMSKFPHEFSGGQRQRIVIARALACRPELLICDESVAALDVSVQAQVLNLLNSLKAELGLTLLFISHDLNVVYYMSDRIMVMNQGRIEEMGSADKVFYHPEYDYTRRLLSSLPGRRSALAPEG